MSTAFSRLANDFTSQLLTGASNECETLESAEAFSGQVRPLGAQDSGVTQYLYGVSQTSLPERIQFFPESEFRGYRVLL